MAVNIPAINTTNIVTYRPSKTKLEYNHLTRPLIDLWCYIKGTSCRSIISTYLPRNEFQVISGGGMRYLRRGYCSKPLLQMKSSRICCIVMRTLVIQMIIKLMIKHKDLIKTVILNNWMLVTLPVETCIVRL